MKKQKICSLLSAGVIFSTVLVAPLAKPAFALSGIKANNKYTFSNISCDKPVSSEDLNKVVKVHVVDANGTVNQDITPGQSIITKTDTITWNDSYENVTAFYLHVEEGYEATILVDGEEGKIEPVNDGVQVKVNSDLGKDKTHVIENLPGYEQVFYFTNAGKEAWSKNHTFEIKLKKMEGHVQVKKYYDNLNGNVYEEYTEWFPTTYGTELNRASLGLAEDEYIVGANTVKFDGTPIKVVKRPNISNRLEYGFTYVSDANADENIKSVNAYWNGNKDNFVPVSLNETVKLKTNDLLWDNRKINFIIEVEKGYELTGKLSNGNKLEVKYDSSNENSDFYNIEFTRAGAHGLNKNPVNETFSLQTNTIK